AVPAALYRLADLQPTTLAIMHGSSFVGDSATALRELAADYEQRLAA
ncbi:MBL fold metallo-hydrolase, partial [Nocardia cyriacigeorgica]|nr:MBL fold metallo-hydrolase [Nocardia cyriacigeorgica]